MKKNYFKILFISALVATSTMMGQNVSNVTLNGVAGTGATGTEFVAGSVKVEQGANLTTTWTVTHGTNMIERAFMVIKVGSPTTTGNVGNAYNNIFDSPGTVLTFTETFAYPIPSDAPIGKHTVRVSGKNFTATGSGWGTPADVEIEVVAAGSLSTAKFNSFEFNTYPNPVTNVLNINSQETIQSIEVFNLLGKRVLSTTDVNGSLDVSSLSKSVYILKLTSNKGVSTKRFVKQ